MPSFISNGLVITLPFSIVKLMTVASVVSIVERLTPFPTFEASVVSAGMLESLKFPEDILPPPLTLFSTGDIVLSRFISAFRDIVYVPSTLLNSGTSFSIIATCAAVVLNDAPLNVALSLSLGLEISTVEYDAEAFAVPSNIFIPKLSSESTPPRTEAAPARLSITILS